MSDSDETRKTWPIKETIGYVRTWWQDRMWSSEKMDSTEGVLNHDTYSYLIESCCNLYVFRDP